MTTKQLKRHIRKIRGGWFFSVIWLLVAVASLCSFFWLKDACYDAWICPRKGTVQERVSYIERAVSLRPLEAGGYHNILDVFLEDGIFAEHEHNRFQKLLIKNQQRMNRNPETFTPLYRRLAFIYLTNYDASTEKRLKSAYSYLEVAAVRPDTAQTEKEKVIANAYLEIEVYCREYLWATGSLRKPTAAETSGLVRRIHAILDTMLTEPDAYRLSYACSVAWLLSQHRALWSDQIGADSVAALTTALQAQCEKEVSDAAAVELKSELQMLLLQKGAGEYDQK